jgi:hypothetical protein
MSGIAERFVASQSGFNFVAFVVVVFTVAYLTVLSLSI